MADIEGDDGNPITGTAVVEGTKKRDLSQVYLFPSIKRWPEDLVGDDSEQIIGQMTLEGT